MTWVPLNLLSTQQTFCIGFNKLLVGLYTRLVYVNKKYWIENRKNYRE